MKVFLSILVGCASVFVFYYGYKFSSPLVQDSAAALQAFAAQEENELLNATDVPLGVHASFSGIGCVTTETREEAASAFRESLADVPPDILTKILARALPPADGESSARYESDDTVDGKHTYILAFWHTYSETNKVKSCISLAGGKVKPADRIVGMTTKKAKKMVGYTKCGCKLGGYFCSSCPLVEETEESVPLSVPVRWSAKQHRDMQLVLRKQSIEMIKSYPLEEIGSSTSSRAISHGEGSTPGV
jgi:hypothetical protein